MAGRVAGWEESWRLKLISAEVEVEAELGKNTKGMAMIWVCNLLQM